jgi:MarR family transcriptional regulator, lower aerobic nicotinate degradation pathway regulator
MGRVTLIPMHTPAQQIETAPSETPGAFPRELLASPAFLLSRLGFAIKGRSITEFAQQGFTPYHFGVLALLEEGAAETQATIADALRLDRSQLVGLLDGLEERGLIERRRDPLDRRRQAVSLTAAGRRTLVGLRSTVKKVEDEFLAPLSAADREALHGLLLRLVRHHDPRCAGLDEPV